MPRRAAYIYPDLKAYITPTAIRLAAQRFARRFKPEVMDIYNANDNGPLAHELFGLFGRATDADHVRDNDAFMKHVTKEFSRDDRGTPIFQFRVNGNMLFVCVENHENRNRDGELEPQLAVIWLFKLDDDGNPILHRAPKTGKTGKPHTTRYGARP